MDAGLGLLDRQLVDRDGRLVGKVDDVELAVPDDGGDPYVVALLSGRGSLAKRIGGRLGRVLGDVSNRLHTDLPSKQRIPIEAVVEIGDHVTLSLSREQLATDELERAARDGIVGRIPGGSHRAPE